MFLSSLSAIIYTKGQTFQTVIFFSLIGLIIFLRKNKNKEANQNFSILIKNKTRFLTIAGLAVFSFVLIYYINGAPTDSLNIDVYYDFYYYSKLSTKLIEVGVEHPNILLSSYLNTSNNYLYHYTDLWFNGYINKILTLRGTETLMFVTYPILLFLTLLGTVGVLFEKLHLSVLKIILFSIVLLYGCSFYVPLENFKLYKQAFFLFQGSPGLNCTQTKTLILFPSLFLAFYFLKRESLISFTFWILIAMSSYNTTIPVLAAGSFMIFVLKIYQVFLKKKLFLKQNLIFAVVIFILFFIFLYMYIVFFTIKETTPMDPPTLKSIIILFIEYMISPWLVYLFIGFIVFIEIIKKRVDEFQFMLILFLLGGQMAGALFVSVNHSMSNINQGLSNPIPPLMLVFIIFFLKTIPKNIFLYLSCLILLTFSSFHNYYLNKNIFFNDENKKNKKYSSVFKEKIYDEINFNPNKVVWATVQKKNISTTFHYSFETPGSFIFNIPNSDYPLDISPYLSDSVLTFCKLPENSPFSLCNAIIKNPSLSEKTLIDFLFTKKVSYLFVENQTILPSLLLIQLELVAKDKFTGDAFYRLKF